MLKKMTLLTMFFVGFIAICAHSDQTSSNITKKDIQSKIIYILHSIKQRIHTTKEAMCNHPMIPTQLGIAATSIAAYAAGYPEVGVLLFFGNECLVTGYKLFEEASDDLCRDKGIFFAMGVVTSLIGAAYYYCIGLAVNRID